MAPAMGRFPGFPRRDAEYLQSASIPATSHCCSSVRASSRPCLEVDENSSVWQSGSSTSACCTCSSAVLAAPKRSLRSEEHTSELQSLMRTSYAVVCLNKNSQKNIFDSTLIPSY